MTSLDERRFLFSRKRKRRATLNTINDVDEIFYNIDDVQNNFNDIRPNIAPAKNSKNEELLYPASEYSLDDFNKSFMFLCRKANVTDATADKFLHLFKWKAILFYVAPVVLPHFLIDGNLNGKKRENTRKQIFNLLECIAALACLMQDVVKEESIQHSENLLNTWFDERNALFKHNEYVPKTHDVMHFPNQVRLHGPLQCSSCFGGENVLQTLNNIVTCTVPRTIMTQISQRLSYLNLLNKWRSEQRHEKLKEMLNAIEKKTEELVNEVSIPDEILAEIVGEENIDRQKPIGLKMYENCGYTYYPASSKRKKNNDSLCYFKDENQRFKLGTIRYFFKTNNSKIYAQIEPLTMKPMYKQFDAEENLGKSNSFLFYGMVDTAETHQFMTIEANNIVKKAFLIESLNNTYVVPILHVFEHN
uniref:Uncharacterized protein n=1 Tax=Panagrolaimus davidi TaxID=227884 RepID=A0A914QFS9_9BILA